MKQTGRRFDAAAFYGGTNSEAYRYLGAHRTRRSGKDGYVFRTWAPNAAHVSVVGDFCGWNGYAHPMERTRTASGSALCRPSSATIPTSSP